MKVEESLNVKFDETPPPNSPPLVDDKLLEVDIIENQRNFFCFVSSIEPKNIKEVIQDESWTMAMQEELTQFKTNDIWCLSAQFLAIFFTPTSCVFPFFTMPKENKTNLKRTARISVRPCCFVNPRTSPLYQQFSPLSDYTSGAPPTSPIISPPLSPIKINSIENCLLTPKSTPPPLTTPPPAPTQPSKLTSPVAIKLDPSELLFSTPPSQLLPLPPLETNNPLSLLTHEMYCKHCQRT
ncbi:hypothetical protein Tco_0450910 [Tanacetum coccineum]